MAAHRAEERDVARGQGLHRLFGQGRPRALKRLPARAQFHEANGHACGREHLRGRGHHLTANPVAGNKGDGVFSDLLVVLGHVGVPFSPSFVLRRAWGKYNVQSEK